MTHPVLKVAPYLVATVCMLVLGELTPLSYAQNTGPYMPMSAPKPPAKTKPALIDSSTKSKFFNFFKNTGRTVEGSEKPAEAPTPAANEPAPFVAPAPEAKAAAPTPPKRPPMLTAPQPTGIDIPELTFDEVQAPRLLSERVDDPKNPMGLMHAKLVYLAAQKELEQKQPSLALAKLEPLKDWLITATEAHIDLYKALNRTPSARVQAEFEKNLALEFAELRDKTLLMIGQAYVANNQPQKAIKPLVAVVQSQTRTSTGLKAYEALQALGFTEAIQLVSQP